MTMWYSLHTLLARGPKGSLRGLRIVGKQRSRYLVNSTRAGYEGCALL